MNPKKLLILDKDGTLVKPKSSDQFVQHPRDQEMFPEVPSLLRSYYKQDWTIAIASNQGGVAAGYKTLKDAIKEIEYCCKITGIRHALFCPDDGQDCLSVAATLEKDVQYSTIRLSKCQSKFHFPGQYRKPQPGMLKTLIALHNPTEVLFVGDRPEDKEAAMNAGVDFMWANQWREGND